MRKYRVCEFTVTGKDYFPLDMLRYDSCWPADTDSVMNLVAHLDNGERKVVLHTYGGVTEGRWASFDWPVSDMKAIL